MKLIFNLIITSITIGLFASCSNKEEQKQTNEQITASKEITKVIGVARIEPEQGLLYVYSNTNGKIDSIATEENNLVKHGNTLISLELGTDLAQLNQENSKISAQQSAVRSAQANANAIQADLQKAKEDVTLNEELFTVKAIAEQTLIDSKAKIPKLQFQFEQQLAEVSQAKNRLTEIASDIQYRKAVIAEKQIKASYSGKVLQWDVHKGDYITAGQKLGQFAPEGKLIAVTEVDELFAERVKTGMRAELRSQASGEKIGEGEVFFVADFLKRKSLFADENTQEDRRVKEVKIHLDSTSKLAINSRVDCIIYIKK